MRVTNTEKANERELKIYGNPAGPCIIAEYGGSDAREDCGGELILRDGKFPTQDKLLIFPLTQEKFNVLYVPDTTVHRYASEDGA